MLSRFFITTLITATTSFAIAAELTQLQPLSDQEIQNNVESGSACWVEKGGKTYLYDDLNQGLIKINGTLIKLKSVAKDGALGSGPYSSKDGKISITVAKNGNLKIQINENKSDFKSSHKCGD